MTNSQLKAEIGKLKQAMDAQKRLTSELFRRVELLNRDVGTLTKAAIDVAGSPPPIEEARS